jgi:hypothetical protein
MHRVWVQDSVCSAADCDDHIRQHNFGESRTYTPSTPVVFVHLRRALLLCRLQTAHQSVDIDTL